MLDGSRPLRLSLALALALCSASSALPAQQTSATGVLTVGEGGATILKSVATLPVRSLPVVSGAPVHKGTILVEVNVGKLERELHELQKDLRAIQEEKRYRTSNKEVGVGGGGTRLFQGPSSGIEYDLAIKESNAMRDMLEVQTKISLASPRAPEDGYLVQVLVGVGTDAKRRKPFVHFAPATQTTLKLTLPPSLAGAFPTGSEVVVSSSESGAEPFRGRVVASAAGPGGVGLTIQPLELPFLALDRPQQVTLAAR